MDNWRKQTFSGRMSTLGKFNIIKVFCLSTCAFVVVSCAWGQQTIDNVAGQDGTLGNSASSILELTNPNSRIGGVPYRDGIEPALGNNSRFTDGSNVLYGTAGNFVGIDRRSSSRFSSGGVKPFQSQKNYDLIALRNEYYRSREAINLSNGSSNMKTLNEPRLVTASVPQKFPRSSRNMLAYGKSREELLKEQKELNDIYALGLQRETNVLDNDFERASQAQRIWMRGQSRGMSGSSAAIERNFGGPGVGFVEYSQIPKDLVGVQRNDSRIGGAALANDRGNAWSFPPLPKTPQEEYQAFIESLEARILQSPDVAPVSPIQIDCQNGVATIRGIVPTPKARVAAGNVLLADPRVRRVNNLLTFLRNDESENGLIPVIPITDSKVDD